MSGNFINANTANPGSDASVIGFTTTTSNFNFNINASSTGGLTYATSTGTSYPINLGPIGPGVWLINSSINLTTTSIIVILQTNIHIGNTSTVPEQNSFFTNYSSTYYGFSSITSNCMTVAYVSDGQSKDITISAWGRTSDYAIIQSPPVGSPGIIRATKIA